MQSKLKSINLKKKPQKCNMKIKAHRQSNNKNGLEETNKPIETQCLKTKNLNKNKIK